jgi:hypothetical protein
MAGTQVNSGDAIAVKLYSAAVFAGMQRKNTFTNRMTGPAPTQSNAESKIRQQTSPDYPVIRVTDLSDAAGDRVSVDLFHTVGGKPIMGDRQAEGRGEHRKHHQQRDRQQAAQRDPGHKHAAEAWSIPAQQAAQGGTFPRQGPPGAADHAHIPPAVHRKAGGEGHQEEQPVDRPQGLAPGSPQDLLLQGLQQDLQPGEQQGEEHETPGCPAEGGPAVMDGIPDVEALQGLTAEAAAAGGHDQNAWEPKARGGGEARPPPRSRR